MAIAPVHRRTIPTESSRKCCSGRKVRGNKPINPLANTQVKTIKALAYELMLTPALPGR